MNGECHAHLFMDGLDYRAAVNRHKELVDKERVKQELISYRDHQVDYIRDGGDRFGVSVYARSIAKDYGIEYRTPIFAICKKGHYGRIVGRAAETFTELASLVNEVKAQHGDFIKIMVSGIMEYSEFGRISEEPLEEEWIHEMIHIAHEEGMAVMVHGNGKQAVLAAVEAGADSIEHGNYIDAEVLSAMKEKNCIWVPTIVTTGNLIGCGRYEDHILQQIYEMECENLICGYRMGVMIAAGSDAGAYLVPHGKGIHQERTIFLQTLMKEGYTEDEIVRSVECGEKQIKDRFKGELT